MGSKGSFQSSHFSLFRRASLYGFVRIGRVGGGFRIVVERYVLASVSSDLCSWTSDPKFETSQVSPTAALAHTAESLPTMLRLLAGRPSVLLVDQLEHWHCFAS